MVLYSGPNLNEHLIWGIELLYTETCAIKNNYTITICKGHEKSDGNGDSF